ncbi:ankyrin [Stylonychia lemnae]|uniref:Ankyrin n=1 Tax=Stylonychia lemnae TaxID=5949 RepID=A0A078B5P1_STYLE|nr:ankyrin [Stylonychia lemnae]|eukprot:CDW89526.1 ankyrin [Stylonychia lemnae]
MSLDLGAPSYDEDIAELRRNKFLTKKHSIPEKMELYNSSTKGNLEDLRKIVEEKNYSLVEEVSKAGYYWTVFHYASHYGHAQVLQYLIDHFEGHQDQFDIFNLQTTEGKTPLFCAILSGDIKLEQKKEIVKLWFDTYKIDLSLRKKTGEDLLELAKKNQLYEYIIQYCIRED